MNVHSRCHPEIFGEVLSGTFPEESMAQFETHLESCPSCRNGLEQFAATKNDWNRISDFFALDRQLTDPYAGPQTVDIQLKSSQPAETELADAGSSPGFSTAAADVLGPASHPEMLGRIDGFEIEQVIGEGGMGIVYKGYDTELNRPVAIKVLAAHLAANGVARQRFAREARAAAAVIHPNVVPIHSVNSSARYPYLVMTLVSGRSLQAHVTNHGPLPVKDIVRISRQIAAGLSAAHQSGLVHRDIKPANILLEKDVSRVMITDFGLARAADDAAITQTGWLAGTPHYMSPEQASGKTVDHRSDLFSLGSVMYFMATGREPFRAEIPVAVLQKIACEQPNPVRSINSDATRTLQRVIERLIAKRPEDRFQSAEKVEAILTQYLAHLEQPATQPKPKFRGARKSRAGAWLFGILATAAMLSGTAWSVGWLKRSEPKFFEQPSQEPVSWPIGLQSPADWQREFNDLESRIRMLEQPDQGRPYRGNPDSPDPDTQTLEQSIRHLENLLGGN